MQGGKNDGTEPTGGGPRPILLGFAIGAFIVIVIVLHLTGVIGPNLHR